MTGIFDLCSRACETVSPSEKFVWYEFAGFKNERGRAVPAYAEKGEIEARIQSVPGDGLIRSGGITQIPARRAVYVRVGKQGAPGAHSRYDSKSGDLMKRIADGSVWLVTSVEEDFSASGWRRLELALQTGAPLIPENTSQIPDAGKETT